MGGARRRILLVTLGTLVVSLAVFGVLLHQHHQLQKRLLEQRDRAVRAVEQGRYADARVMLEGYLHRAGAADAEATAALARAVLADPAASRADRVYAMRLFRRVGELAPQNLTVRLELLELQKELDFSEAQVQTADQILERADDEMLRARARQAKARALLRLERYSAALEVAADMVHSAGTDALDAHHLVLEIVAAGPWPARDVTEYARDLVREAPDDVRYQVLLGAAHRLAGRTPEAEAVLMRCAAQPPPDADTAYRLFTELEAAERFDTALTVLEHSAADFNDPRFHGALIARLWQRGREQAVIEHIDTRAEASASSGDALDHLEADRLAIGAMARVRVEGRDAAEPLLAAIRRRSVTDPGAAAWSVYLTGVFERPIDADLAARRCRRALMHDSDNGYIRFALGKALAAQGERRAALAQWRRAADLEPAWAAPHLHAARAMTELGLADQAVAFAGAARRRAGADDVRARVAVAEARQLRLARGSGGDSPAALLEFVEAIQRDHRHEPRTLPIYVNLLAKKGQREDASETLLASLDARLPERTLLTLARVSRAHGLGLAEACYAQCESLHGRTPALARARALEAWKRGRAERALTELRIPDHLDTADEARRAWELAQARVYDEAEPEAAIELWDRLLQRHPDSLSVHRAAVRSTAGWRDRSLARRAIDRLRDLTGEEAMAWRLAEARWLLEDEDAGPAEASRAALTLAPVRRAVPELVEPRLWLARAFVRMDEPAVAIAELRGASEHAPYHQPVLLELARLLMEENQPREALVNLDRVVDNPASSVPQLQAAAAMLVRLQGWDAAVAALTRAAEAGGRTTTELLAAGLAEEEPRGTDDARFDRERD